MAAKEASHGKRLRVVVVNHNSGDLLARCVKDILAIDWRGSLEVVVVDNASTDDSLASISAKADPRIRLLSLDSNGGFGANNLALDDLKSVDWVALVNPDAFVPENFAVDLIRAFDDPDVGAASPKIVFDDLFSPIEVRIDGDRDVRLVDVSVAGQDMTNRVQVLGKDAARLPEPSGPQWHLGQVCTLLVPAGAAGQVAQLSLRAASVANITVSPKPIASIDGQPTIVTTRTTSVEVPLSSPGAQYIQNAGSSVDRYGVGHSRGFLSRDSDAESRAGPDDHPVDVFAWCGAAVMLSSNYLLDVGLFEPDFFLYYEDTDLSWRAQSRGWTHRYVPEVVVRHRHSASTGQGSAITDVYQQRNRLRMLGRNASLPALARGFGHSIAATTKIGLRRTLAIGQPNTKGHSQLFSRRARGIAAAVGDMRSTARARKTLNSRRTVPRKEVESQLKDQGEDAS